MLLGSNSLTEGLIHPRDDEELHVTVSIRLHFPSIPPHLADHDDVVFTIMEERLPELHGELGEYDVQNNEFYGRYVLPLLLLGKDSDDKDTILDRLEDQYPVLAGLWNRIHGIDVNY